MCEALRDVFCCDIVIKNDTKNTITTKSPEKIGRNRRFFRLSSFDAVNVQITIDEAKKIRKTARTGAFFACVCVSLSLAFCFCNFFFIMLYVGLCTQEHLFTHAPSRSLVDIFFFNFKSHFFLSLSFSFRFVLSALRCACLISPGLVAPCTKCFVVSTADVCFC